MKSTDNPAPIATQEVAFSDVASFRNWADCAAKLFDFEYSSEISMDGRILWIVHDTTFGPIPPPKNNTIAIYKNE